MGGGQPLPSRAPGESEEWLENLRRAAPSLPLSKIRKLKGKFERRLDSIRQAHPESDEVSYSGPLDLANPLDQIRFLEEAVDICEIQIDGRHRRAKKNTPVSQGKEDFTFDAEYRNITFRGEPATLTTNQARTVQLLHERYLHGTPDVHNSTVLEHLESPSSRLRDTFRKSRLWGKLIIRGSRKGTVRLNLPDPPRR